MVTQFFDKLRYQVQIVLVVASRTHFKTKLEPPGSIPGSYIFEKFSVSARSLEVGALVPSTLKDIKRLFLYAISLQ